MGDQSVTNPEKNFYKRSASTVPTQRSENGPAALLARAKSVQEYEGSRTQRSASIIAIEELVQCGICCDKLTEPRMLQCQHTFCLSCLEAHLISTASKLVKKQHEAPSQQEIRAMVAEAEIEIRCPTCRIPVKIEKGLESLRSLPSNVYIDSLLKVLEGNVSPAPKVSGSSCIKCGTVDETSQKKCRHCKQVFCSICWTEHLSTLKANLSTLLEQLVESETRLQHRIDDFHERCDKLRTNIHSTAEEKIIDIKIKEEKTLEQVDQVKMREENFTNELRTRVGELKKEIEGLNFEGLASDAHKVDTFMSFHRNTSKILNDISRWGDIRINFDSKTFKISHNNEPIERNSTVEGKAQGAVDVKNPLESVETMATHYLSRTFTPKLVWAKCPRPAGIGSPPWAPNRLYITATDRKVVLIMDREMSKVTGKLAAVDMLCPHGVAFCNKRTEIYVTDKWKHCVHVFSNDGEYQRTLCSLGSGPGELRSPEGIAINQLGEIIVCDVGNDRVVVLDPSDGHQISTIGMIGKRTELQAPTGVAVHNDRIIIADNGNHAIKVFSASGQKLMEFGCIGNNKGQFRNPEVVTCDPMGFILVGDAGNARIQVFRPDGTLVRVFGGYGEAPGKFAWISGLAVTEELNIITTDYKNRRLQIF